MKIAITGGTGFIGRHLTEHFKAANNELLFIGRKMLALSAAGLAAEISGCNIIINLAGEPVAGRWTKTKKEKILSSRIQTTRKLTEAVNMLSSKPGLFISASAIGIYNDKQIHDESSLNFGNDYLAEVCNLWENETDVLSKEVRKVIIRIGLVLGKDGGTLQKLLPLFRLGLGGKIGSGRQMMSWIYIDDLVKALDFIIKNNISGIVNLTAPKPVSNIEFTKKLSKELKRPAIFPVPVFALKLLFGEGAGVITQSSNVLPKQLIKTGFEFKFSTIESAFAEICKNR